MRKTSPRQTARSRTVAYDVAAQLRTPEEMAAYLDIARAKGMSQVAREAGLSRESLYRALSEGGNPSFATILKVTKALGVRLHAEAA